MNKVEKPYLDYQFDEGPVSDFSRKLLNEVKGMHHERYQYAPLSAARSMAGIVEGMKIDNFALPDDSRLSHKNSRGILREMSLLFL